MPGRKLPVASSGAPKNAAAASGLRSREASVNGCEAGWSRPEAEMGIVISQRRPACRDLLPVVQPFCELLAHHRGRPRPWTDEAHVAAQDVQELRQLVQVPPLEHAPGAGEVGRVLLGRSGMVVPSEALEYVHPEH